MIKGKFDQLSLCQVVYLLRTLSISTTAIIEKHEVEMHKALFILNGIPT